MDLADFISTTLVSIKEGIKTANEKTDNYFTIFSKEQVINFNIAVEVAKENLAEKGGRVKVYVVEAGIGGNSKTMESNVSRIDFTVGLNQSIT